MDLVVTNDDNEVKSAVFMTDEGSGVSIVLTKDGEVRIDHFGDELDYLELVIGNVNKGKRQFFLAKNGMSNKDKRFMRLPEELQGITKED